MTRDELNRRRMMFQINAKKNNLLKPEYEVQNPNVLRHSATNDYLEFRKKVAQGAKMQKEARVNLFNVTEANEQYRQELADKTILVHTGAGGMTNAYVAKLDDFYGPGKPRYFYTKEEWEGYQRNKQGASQAGAQRGAKEAFNNKSDNYKNNANAAQNSGADRAAKQKEEASKVSNKSYTDMKMEADSKNKSLAEKADEAYAKSKANETKQQIKESFNKLTGKNKPDLVGGREAAEKAGQKTTREQNAKRSEALNIRNDKDRWAKYDNDEGKKAAKEVAENDPRFKNIKTIDDAANYPGGAKQLYDDYEKAIEENLNRKKQNADYANNAGADRAAKDSAEATKQADRKKFLEANQANKETSEKSGKKETEDTTRRYEGSTVSKEEPKVSKEYQEEKEYNTTGKSSEKKETSFSNEERQKKIIDAALKGNDVTAEDLASEYGVSKEYVRELVYNTTGKTVPTKSEIEEQKKKAISGGSSNTKNLSSNKSSGGYTEFTYDPKQNKTVKVKHSSEEDGITTDAMTPEQEYLSFRQKVESGLKHFGQTRGLISIPINQALKNGESLAHAGMTNKYYAKIDDFWGKGKPRYFYSKEEWDGYQKNKQGAGQAEAARAKKEKYNANYESNIKKNEGYAQNAGADRAKQEKLSYVADSARKDVDNLFKDGYQQTNEKVALNSKIKDDYVHDAFNQALAEANGTTVENLRKDPGLRSKLLEEFNRGTDYEKVIKVSQLMNNYYDALIDQDTNYVLNSIDFVKDYYHNGNPTGKGNTYSTSYKKDGFAIAKDLEDKWNTAIGNGKKNKSEVFVDFLKSLTDDERKVINMVNDFHYNNRLPGLLRQSQEGREAAEKEGQMITRRNTERNKYHMLND